MNTSIRQSFLAVLLAIPGLAAATQNEQSVACDEGNEPVPMEYGSHTTDCALAQPGDTDRFSFSGNENDLVRLVVQGTTSFLDPALELRDPVGTVIAMDSCAGTSSGCSFTVEVTLPATGQYQPLVRESGANETGNYRMQVERLLPAPLLMRLTYDTDVNDTISPPTDYDYFHFYGQPNTTVRVNVRGTTSFTDPAIEIRDPVGTLVAQDFCAGTSSGCAFAVDLSPQMTGDYSMLVRESGANETGSYRVSLWCLVGECEDEPGIADPESAMLTYVVPVVNAISPSVDGDFYSFNATENAGFRVTVRGATSFFDPAIEIRNPNGDVVVDGLCAGTSSGCAFAEDYIPLLSGTYTLLIRDSGINETGNYQISLWCDQDNCDSDADGLVDGDEEILNYGQNLGRAISPAVDGDFFIFDAVTNDQIEITVVGNTSFFDPALTCRDPTGAIVIDTSCSGSSSGCSFVAPLVPAMDGIHRCRVRDSGANETGNFGISLQCLFGTCPDIVPAPICIDNCSTVANADQLDTDADGFGNVCDPDFNNDGMVNFLDLDVMREQFFSNENSPNWDPDIDLTADGAVNFADLQIMKNAFFGSPGPSCAAQNEQ